MRVVIVAAVSLTLAFGVMPVNSQQTTAATVIDLSMDQGDEVNLELTGSGWALVRVTATEALDLNFTLTHETMDDLCIFSDDGDGIYDEGHVTGFFLYNSSHSAYSGEWFSWHGTPGWSVWPGQSGECGASDPLTLAPGDTAKFVIADTTGGYGVTLRGGLAGSAAETVAVALQAHDGFVRADPSPTDTAVVSESGLDVLRERTWSSEFVLHDAVLFLSNWDMASGNGDLPTGAHAGAVWDNREIVATDTATPTPFTGQPGMEFTSAGPGGFSFGRGTTTTHWTDPGTFDLRYTRGDVSATLAMDRAVGAYFIAIPQSA